MDSTKMDSRQPFTWGGRWEGWFRESGKWGRLLAGGILTFWGLRRWSLPGMLATVAGVGLVHRSLSRAPTSTVPLPKKEVSSGRLADESRRVEEALLESFPASDPPASY